MNKNKNVTTILPIMVGTVAIVALAMTPAMADNSKKAKKPASHSSAAAAAATASGAAESVSSPRASDRDHKSGPAWKTIGGTVKQIKDDTYTVEDYEGNQVQLFVGQDTKHLRQKRVGDTVRAEITRGGFANSIQ
jgi:uncharacterized protein YdeI (BOF family)